jgi:Domain of unknown function (DUF6487)
MRADLKEYGCPECGQPMERGYVRARHSIRWESWAQGTLSAWPFSFLRAEKLTPGGIFGASDPRCMGLRCRACGLVLFQQGQG